MDAADATNVVSANAIDHPTTRAAEERLAAAEGALISARAGMLPQVALTAEATEYQDEDASAAPRESQTSLGVDVSLPLFDGMRNVNEFRRAGALVDAEDEALRGARAGLIVEIVSAVALVERSGEGVSAWQEHLQNMHAFLREQRARLRAGDVSETEIEQIRGRIARAEAELAQSRAARAEAEARLASLMRDMSGPPPKPLNLRAHIPSSQQETVTIALAENPQILEADARQNAAERGVDVARGAFFPDVTFSVDMNETDDRYIAGGSNLDRDVDFSVGLSMPLFDGGKRYGELRARRAVYREHQFTAEAIRRRVEADAIGLWGKARAATRATTFAKDRLARARLALKGVQRARRIGARRTEDELDAHLELTQARVFLAGTRYDAIVFSHQLLSTLGRLEKAYGL